MARKSRKKKIGVSPGSLIYVGDKTDEPVKISVITYNEHQASDAAEVSVDELLHDKNGESVTWINVSGIHKMEVIEKIGKRFHLHPLLLEDIVNTQHRAKIDDYEDYLFAVLKMIFWEPDSGQLQFEHVCIILGSGFLISFQEREGDVFESVRERIQKGKGRIRKSGAGYLAYTLVDTIVDHYFLVLEQLGDEIEGLQQEALERPTQKTLAAIHAARHQVVYLRKSIWPMREMINSLLRGESGLIEGYVLIYLQDVYDHVIQVIDTIETYRDLLAGILECYMSTVSLKMNETMKVLTVMATLFIPLTFFAGVYGMNFRFMPELEWQYGYPVFWAVAAAVFVSMVIWFKTRKWL
ncbi:MAG: magnesium and cobalt transport protein CorA [Desulfobacteraceae bacterium]|nr:MAG: magnesium and cobalt transport protein CorA [Desulfobacteraceae bacterium]